MCMAPHAGKMKRILAARYSVPACWSWAIKKAKEKNLANIQPS